MSPPGVKSEGGKGHALERIDQGFGWKPPLRSFFGRQRAEFGQTQPQIKSILKMDFSKGDVMS